MQLLKIVQLAPNGLDVSGFPRGEVTGEPPRGPGAPPGALDFGAALAEVERDLDQGGSRRGTDAIGHGGANPRLP